MDNELLVKTVRDLCKRNNIPVSQLENELNFGAGLISRWAKSSPSIDKIIDIADYFHVSIDEVVGREQNLMDDTTGKFVSTLIKVTNTGSKKWMPTMFSFLISKEYKVPPDIMYNIKDFNSYPKDERCVENFVMQYEEAYITLKCHVITKCNAIQKYEFSLFVQTNSESNPVYQNCEQNHLLNLYINIVESIYGKMPETLSNDFKERFIEENQ